MLALRPGECKLGSRAKSPGAENWDVTSALQYLAWIGSATLVYLALIAALRARR
jgi:hypothetical protein